jgi:hypothetical protein
VSVRLVAHLAEIGLIGGVDVHVLLPVAAVGEAPVAALELTLEGLLPCGRQTGALAADPETPRTFTQAARGQRSCVVGEGKKGEGPSP